MYRVIGLTFVAVVLLVTGSPAQAADAATCDAFAAESVAKAQGVRQFACGYDLKGPRWTTDRNGLVRWCRATPKDMVAKELAQRRGEMKICQTCYAYAGLAADSAADNRKLKCGFTGPRWNDGAAAHFAWCMALRENESAQGADIAASYKSIAAKMEISTGPETLERIVQIHECRLP